MPNDEMPFYPAPGSDVGYVMQHRAKWTVCRKTTMPRVIVGPIGFDLGLAIVNYTNAPFKETRNGGITVDLVGEKLADTIVAARWDWDSPALVDSCGAWGSAGDWVGLKLLLFEGCGGLVAEGRVKPERVVPGLDVGEDGHARLGL